jgi:multidrug efflux system membrane fusion protein
VIRSPIDGVIEKPDGGNRRPTRQRRICATVVEFRPDDRHRPGVGAEHQPDFPEHAGNGPKLVTGEVLEGRCATSRPPPIRTRARSASRSKCRTDGKARDGVTAVTLLPLPAEKAHKISPAILTLNDAGQVGIRAVDENNRTVFYPVNVLGGEQDGMWVGGLPEKWSMHHRRAGIRF